MLASLARRHCERAKRRQAFSPPSAAWIASALSAPRNDGGEVANRFADQDMRNNKRPPMLPLEGLTVIAVEQAVAAPFCSSRLADAGAHVIKVERPEGDFARGYDAAAKGQSSYFVWLNRGKDSVVIDLATREGRASAGRADRQRRRAAAESQARLDGQARLLAGAAAQGLSAADLLHHLRLWRRRPLRRSQGL